MVINVNYNYFNWVTTGSRNINFMLNSYAILYNYVSLYAVIERFRKFYVRVSRNPIIRSICNVNTHNWVFLYVKCYKTV